MNVSTFIIRIAFLALPGLLASKLYRKARGRTAKKNWEDFLEILLFSLMSYLVLALCLSLGNCLNLVSKPQAQENSNIEETAIEEQFDKVWSELTVFKALADDKISLDWIEITCASLLGILLAIIASYLHKYSAVTWVFRKIGATNRVTDEDIWELFHSGKSSTEWLYVRDHIYHLIYYGYIAKWSDSEKDREIIMENVSVYDDESTFLYETPLLYVCRNKFGITIELPRQVENDNQGDTGTIESQESETE